MIEKGWPGFAYVDCPRRFELVKFNAGDLADVEVEEIRAHLGTVQDTCKK